MRKLIWWLGLGLAMAAGEAFGALQGNGSDDNPYLIGSYADLVDFARMVNDGYADWADALVTNDITATGTNWVAIGTGRYSGTFNGGGHTISGLANSGTPTCAGLFGTVADGGVVRNVRLEGVAFNGTYAGGIAGHNSGTVSNCYVSGSVQGENTAGGIAGDNRGTVANCCNAGAMSGGMMVGGIVGDNFGGGTVSNCYNSATVSGGVGALVGGIAGNNHGTSQVKCCHNTGAVSCGVESGIRGGIVGYNNGSLVENSYCLDSLGVKVIGDNNGDVDGESRTLSAEYYTVEESFCGWDFTHVWEMGTVGPVLRSLVLPGDGTQENPYRIWDYEGLMAFARRVDGEWQENAWGVLAADIVAEGSNWVAIGENPACYYQGTFDGAGHTISRLANAGTPNYAGLFGYVVGGTVRNVRLENVAFNGELAGGVAGFNHSGTVSNCWVSGSVWGSWYAGGVVGENYNTRSTVLNCHNSATVSGGEDTEYVGGVAGHNDRGTVANCHSTGAVTGGFVRGGVLGYNYSGTVANSYCPDSLEVEAIGTNSYGRVQGSGALSAGAYTNEASFNEWDFTEVWGMGRKGPYLQMFGEEEEMHTVTFAWHGGSFETNYPHGTAASGVTVPGDPDDYAEGGTNYTFRAWEPATVADVTTNATYEARYAIVPAVAVSCAVGGASGTNDEMTVMVSGPADCDGVADVAVYADATGAGDPVWTTNGVALAAGEAEFSVSPAGGVVPAQGQHVFATYRPNDRYAGATASNRVMGTSSIDIDVNATYLCDDDIVIALTPVHSTGAIEVYLDNDPSYSYPVENNQVIIAGGLGASNYVVVAVLAGDANYLGSGATNTFEVVKRTPVMAASANDVGEGEDVTVVATLVDAEDATGSVFVYVGGDDYSDEVVAGEANVIVPGLAPGYYSATVEFSGDDKYCGVSTNVSFRVGQPQEEVDGVIWYYEPHGDGTAVVTGVASNHATGNLTMPEQLGGLTVTEVGEGAFIHCTNITGMAIAGGVTNIMEQAFKGCDGLTDMTIPDLVTDIGQYALTLCSGLTNLTIGAGVTNIENGAFYDCPYLATLSLPEGLVSIGNWAFGYNALADVRIPDSVADIGEHAFDLCGRMTNVWLGTGIESVGENAFASCSYLETIWVPAEQMGTGLLDAAGLPDGCEVRYYGNVAVAFDANGGTTGSAWQAEAAVEIGSNLNELLGATVPEAVEAEVVTAPEGTMFGGYGVAFGGGAETTFAPGDPIDVEVTGAATVRYLWENLYTITVTGGSSTNQFAAVGIPIDITANEPEVGEAFVQWSSNVEGLEFGDAGASPTWFTMPATNVAVEAVFRPIVISGIDPAGYPYTGSAVTPDFTVALEGVDLLIGTNYTVSWVDNTNAGTAWVVVTLTNRPWGVQSNSFTIRKRAVTLTSASAEKAYDGTALTAGEVAVGGDGFAAGEGATNRVTGTQTGVGTSTNFFTYELNEGTLEGNYEVTTAEGTLTVTPRSITNAVIAEIGTQRYEGQPVRPVPTVTDGEPSIIGAGDYEVSYEGNEGPGEGTVRLTGKNNYTGETSARFTIVPAKVTLTVTAGKWGRVAVETNGVLAGRVGPDATRAFAIDYGARVVAGAVPNAGFAATNEEGTATFDSFTNDAARAYGFRPDPTNAAVRWKFSSAVGRYFAQVAVPAHAGYEEAMAGFAFLFADRTNGTGEVYAQLWNAAGRAPEGVLVTDRGVGYRGVALGTNGFKGVAEGKTAVWGVTDATLADGKTAVPAGERVVGLYVRKRVSPVTGNETAGEVENFVGYLTWKTEGVRWFLPVVEGGAGSGVARGAERAAGAGGAGRFGVMRHAYAPGTLSVAAALGLGAEAVAAGTPAVGIAEFAAGEGGAVAGRVEAVAKKGEVSSSFGSGATVRVFSAGTPGGAWKEESGAKVEAATGKFQVPAREGEARFFRAVVGTREVYE